MVGLPTASASVEPGSGGVAVVAPARLPDYLDRSGLPSLAGMTRVINHYAT
ncbi:MAG: hypothetical protein M0006_16135 [Magnetospirillum sp.]|nr:hypothetical protein [Magnetospirillum sp.]